MSLDPDSFAPLVGSSRTAASTASSPAAPPARGSCSRSTSGGTSPKRFLAARPEGFQVAIHAGAQTTRDTVALAAHAREVGADAVAVIAPPYFPLGSRELFDHFRSAADACDPLPFYVYEFAARSGYAIPVDVVEQLRREQGNVVGMKVSDTPFDAIEPYLVDGMDVFVGSEPLGSRRRWSAARWARSRDSHPHGRTSSPRWCTSTAPRRTCASPSSANGSRGSPSTRR